MDELNAFIDKLNARQRARDIALRARTMSDGQMWAIRQHVAEVEASTRRMSDRQLWAAARHSRDRTMVAYAKAEIAGRMRGKAA